MNNSSIRGTRDAAGSQAGRGAQAVAGACRRLSRAAAAGLFALVVVLPAQAVVTGRPVPGNSSDTTATSNSTATVSRTNASSNSSSAADAAAEAAAKRAAAAAAASRMAGAKSTARAGGNDQPDNKSSSSKSGIKAFAKVSPGESRPTATPAPTDVANPTPVTVTTGNDTGAGRDVGGPEGQKAAAPGTSGRSNRTGVDPGGPAGSLPDAPGASAGAADKSRRNSGSKLARARPPEGENRDDHASGRGGSGDHEDGNASEGGTADAGGLNSAWHRWRDGVLPLPSTWANNKGDSALEPLITTRDGRACNLLTGQCAIAPRVATQCVRGACVTAPSVLTASGLGASSRGGARRVAGEATAPLGEIVPTRAEWIDARRGGSRARVAPLSQTQTLASGSTVARVADCVNVALRPDHRRSGLVHIDPTGDGLLHSVAPAAEVSRVLAHTRFDGLDLATTQAMCLPGDLAHSLAQLHDSAPRGAAGRLVRTRDGWALAPARRVAAGPTLASAR